MNSTPTAPKKSALETFIRFVEHAGNKLPHPFMIFLLLSVAVLVLSYALNQAGVSATYTPGSSKAGVASKEVTVTVKNLLTTSMFKTFLVDFVKTYMNFPPVGLVMVMTLGIGFIEEMGFFIALMKKVLVNVPPYLITFILAMVGICANIASDAGIIFATTTGAAIFAASGRSPILGGVTGYVAGHGGFTANLMIAGTDALLAGITESAAKSMGIIAPTHPLINWYFMFLATFVLAVVITFVTERVMPSLLKIESRTNIAYSENAKPTADEIKGLKYAGLATLGFLAVLLLLTLPADAVLRNAKGGFLPSSPLTQSIVGLLFLLFATVGAAYGIGSKKIKNNRDIPKYMTNGLKSSLSFFVIAFPAAFFIEFFRASSMATVFAVKGAEALKYMNLQGIALAIVFVLLVAFLNLFMTSGSAKWLILAPIFVPMFAMMNFSPAMTQLAYRIGDSATNPISPINFFIPVLMSLIEQYKKDDSPVGLGTVISLTLPYSICFLATMLIMMVVWMLVGAPIGPGTSMWLN